MVFQTKTDKGLLTNLQITIPADQKLPVVILTGVYHRPIKRVVHNARDHVPLYGAFRFILTVSPVLFGMIR